MIGVREPLVAVRTPSCAEQSTSSVSNLGFGQSGNGSTTMISLSPTAGAKSAIYALKDALRWLVVLSIIAVGTTALFYSGEQPFTKNALQSGGILILFLGLWIIGLIPDFLAALLYFAFASALALAPAEVVFGGFQSFGLWLMLAGLVIGATIKYTGLGTRIANLLVYRVGSSYPAFVTSL